MKLKFKIQHRIFLTLLLICCMAAGMQTIPVKADSAPVKTASVVQTKSAGKVQGTEKEADTETADLYVKGVTQTQIRIFGVILVCLIFGVQFTYVMLKVRKVWKKGKKK